MLGLLPLFGMALLALATEPSEALPLVAVSVMLLFGHGLLGLLAWRLWAGVTEVHVDEEALTVRSGVGRLCWSHQISLASVRSVGRVSRGRWHGIEIRYADEGSLRASTGRRDRAEWLVTQLQNALHPDEVGATAAEDVSTHVAGAGATQVLGAGSER